MKKKESEKVVDSGLEFLKALNLVTEEKGISKDLIIDAMKQALMTAYKKNYDARTNVRVDFDELTGKFKVISYYVVVDDYIDSTYETDEEGNEIKDLSLVKIDLHTGRHHQIRVQFSHAGHSIFGDQKYGTRGKGKQIALWAYKLTIKHPITKEEMTFRDLPEPIGTWCILRGKINNL